MKPPKSLVLLLALAGCAPPVTQEDWSLRLRTANEELLNKGNLAVAPDVFAPAYTVHLTAGTTSGGHEVIGGFVKGLRAAFPDLRVEVEVLATEGDRVAWVRTSRGTHSAEYMGVPASGRALTWRDMIVTRFEAGKIAEEWAVSDLGEQLRVSDRPPVPGSG